MEDLLLQIQQLEAAHDLWRTLVLVFTVSAAVLGLLGASSSYLAHQKSNQLRKMQAELIRAEDAQRDRQIAEANARAAEANQKAEAERLARIKIEQKLADRVLTDAQVENMANKLKPFAGQEYEILLYWDHRESSSLADRVCLALTKAGWKRIEYAHRPLLSPGTEGVFVSVNPGADESVRVVALSLTETLVAEGILTTQDQRSLAPPNRISLSVGTKPGIAP